ncbi:MAG: hypothetical protein ACP6IY_18920 [Promethearchaeia archaeon]
MKKYKIHLKPYSIICLTIIFMSSLWAIDISVTTLINDGILINQYGMQDANVIYHFAILINVICFFAVASANFLYSEIETRPPTKNN